ncbi:hypothetical protein REPUB_Repub07fG0079000 [Reevesia pubescens]
MLMAAASIKVQWIAEPFMVEALAALKALEFAYEMGFKKIELERDALTVIKRLNGRSLDYSTIGTIIEDAKLKVRTFVACRVCHARKDGNIAVLTLMFIG